MNLKKDKKDEGFQEEEVVIPPEKVTPVQINSAPVSMIQSQTAVAPPVPVKIVQTAPVQTVQTVQTPVQDMSPALDSINQVLSNITSQLSVLTKESQDRKLWEAKINSLISHPNPWAVPRFQPAL